MCFTGSESPIVVVLSGSMEPAFFRGDLLFLTNDLNDPVRVGEVLVFKVRMVPCMPCDVYIYRVVLALLMRVCTDGACRVCDAPLNRVLPVCVLLHDRCKGGIYRLYIV